MRNKKLEQALEFERETQKKFIKSYPIYLAELQNYAKSKGFYDWDEMITELRND